MKKIILIVSMLIMNLSYSQGLHSEVITQRYISAMEDAFSGQIRQLAIRLSEAGVGANASSQYFLDLHDNILIEISEKFSGVTKNILKESNNEILASTLAKIKSAQQTAFIKLRDVFHMGAYSNDGCTLRMFHILEQFDSIYPKAYVTISRQFSTETYRYILPFLKDHTNGIFLTFLKNDMSQDKIGLMVLHKLDNAGYPDDVISLSRVIDDYKVVNLRNSYNMRSFMSYLDDIASQAFKILTQIK